LRHSADVFAIELLDMKQHRRMLLGEDFFDSVDVPMTLHRLQVERGLRTGVIRLRQAFLRSRRRSERRIKAAGFPREKSLRAFDFDANPNIDAATIHTLASCEWIKKSQPLPDR